MFISSYPNKYFGKSAPQSHRCSPSNQNKLSANIFKDPPGSDAFIFKVEDMSSEERVKEEKKETEIVRIPKIEVEEELEE